SHRRRAHRHRRAPLCAQGLPHQVPVRWRKAADPDSHRRGSPQRRPPADIGMLCQNVGTCVAVHHAVLLGKPLISRITTLTGEALGRPMNVEALIGTPVAELLAFAGLDSGKLNRLIMGGPMMGFTLPSMDVPLIKTTNCLLASTLAELPPPPPALPCIRCGECAEVCPASL